jgi:Fic family protein
VFSDPADGATWPSISWEQHPWHRRHEPGTASRGQLRRHSGPYRAAVVPEITHCTPVLSSQTLAEAEAAAAEIARFDTEVGLDLAPFAAVLLRSESAASSTIERLTASARAIAEAELDLPTARGNAAQVVSNTRAMRAAIELADRLDLAAILTMHQALMQAHDPDTAGRLRTEQNWIGGGDLGPHQAMFVPPHPDRVPDAMADLVTFLTRNDLPLLAHAAIAHAQFETIHPFVDGNGRAGRALIHSLLRGKGLTRSVAVPVSAGVLADVDGYFTALTAYREGRPDLIVARLAQATFLAIRNGRTLVVDLHEIRRNWREQLTVRRDSGTWRVLDLLLRQPVVDATYLAAELRLPVRNVYRLLDPLLAAAVLVQTTSRSRDRVWRAPQVLAAVDDFARRAGRRRSVS